MVRNRAEIMVMTRKEEKWLKIVERKKIRKIYRLKNIGEGYQRLMNIKIREIMIEEDVVKIIKKQLFRWYVHIIIRNDEIWGWKSNGHTSRTDKTRNKYKLLEKQIHRYIWNYCHKNKVSINSNLSNYNSAPNAAFATILGLWHLYSYCD